MIISLALKVDHAGEMPVSIHFQNSVMDPSATTWIWYR